MTITAHELAERLDLVDDLEQDLKDGTTEAEWLEHYLPEAIEAVKAGERFIEDRIDAAIEALNNFDSLYYLDYDINDKQVQESVMKRIKEMSKQIATMANKFISVVRLKDKRFVVMESCRPSRDIASLNSGVYSQVTDQSHQIEEILDTRMVNEERSLDSVTKIFTEKYGANKVVSLVA